MTLNTSQTNFRSDRYWFEDYQRVTKEQNSSFFATHSLCTNCSDYYDIPPCQTNFTTDSGCFPSLISSEQN